MIIIGSGVNYELEHFQEAFVVSMSLLGFDASHELENFTLTVQYTQYYCYTCTLTITNEKQPALMNDKYCTNQYTLVNTSKLVK